MTAPPHLSALLAFDGPASIVLAARLTGAAIMIAFQLALAHIAGADQLGIFFLATSLAAIASVFAAGGYPNIVVKVVTRRGAVTARAGALARSASIDIAAVSVVLCGLIAACATFTASAAPMLVAATAIPLMAWGRLLHAFAVTQNRPVLANLPDLLGRPLVMGLGLLLLQLAGRPIDATAAAWLFVAGIALSVGFLAVATIHSGLFPIALADGRLRSKFRAMALPLVAVSALTALIGDLAVVTGGLFLSAAQLGVFALALKIALLVGFVVQTVHQVGMPRIAAANHLFTGVRAEVFHTNRSALAFAFIAAIGIVGGAPLIQPWLGAEFAHAGAILAVLIVAQLIRAYFGPAVPALVLVSANRASGILSLVALAALVAAMAVLAPLFGELGAALALSAAMLVWSASAAVVAAQRGINTIGLGFRRSLAPAILARAFGKAA